VSIISTDIALLTELDRGGRWHFPVIIPNSEIKMAGMRQAVGAETLWKNRRHTRRGLVRLSLREAHNLNGQLNGRGWGSQFSKPFKPKRLMPTGRFNFGVRV